MTEQSTATDLTTDPNEGPAEARFVIELSPRGAQAIKELAGRAGGTVADVFRKAMGLYQLALEARDAGMVVGAAERPEALDTEFVDF